MARPLRVEFEGAIYHVTFRGNERQSIFRDDHDRRRMLQQLEAVVETFDVRLFLLCLMSNHVHLLLETPKGNLGRCMQSLLTGYTVYFNRRHRRAGHLTQGRYAAQLVEGDEYLLRLSRYIHLNPVFVSPVKGLSAEERKKRLRAYRWSTYRSYAGLERPWLWMTYGPLLELVGGGKRKVYRRYVEGGLAETDKEWVDLMKGRPVAIGADDFQQEMKALQKKKADQRRRDDVTLRTLGKWASAEEVMMAVAEITAVQKEEFRKRRRDSVLRAFVSWGLKRYAGLTQREIADHLGISTGASISAQLKKWRTKGETTRRWKQAAKRLEKMLAAYVKT